MIRIEKATKNDADMLAELGVITFLQAHANSAPQEDLDAYMKKNYTVEAFENELCEIKNNYFIFYYLEKPVAYSKIVFNVSVKAISNHQIAKLDRIYLLESHYGSGFAQKLLNFSVKLAKENGQTGLWLYTWKENKRAIYFYQKMGFKIVGEYDFAVSKKHKNPNWIMWLEFNKSDC